MNAEGDRAKQSLGSGTILLLVFAGAICLIFLLSLLTDGTDTVKDTHVEDVTAISAEPTMASEAELRRAREEAEANWPQETLPRDTPETPVSIACSNTICETDRVRFERHDWPLAWRGDYQAQRNVAYCRRDGCDGVMQVNKAEACAWRMIILAAHPTKTDDTDISNLKIACGALDPIEQASAQRKAEAFYERIFHEPLPAM